MRYPKKIGAVVLALVLSLVGLASVAGPAQAVEELAYRSPFKIEYNGDCTVTVSVYGPQYHVASGIKTAGLAVKTDDDSAFTVPEPKAGSGPFTADESLTVRLNQSGFVYYRWFHGAESSDGSIPPWNLTGDWVDKVVALETEQDRNWNAGDFDSSFMEWKKQPLRVPTCATPEEPTSSQLECAAATAPTVAGTIEIPDTEGVQYLLDGEPIDAGTHELAPGTYAVTAEPEPGYAFPPEFTPEWTFTLGAINGCPGTPGLPGDPGADGQDGDDGISGVATGGGGGGELPKTGAGILSPGVLAVAAALLMLLGGLAYWLNRVRRVTFTTG
jgi:hypothetical protein